MYSEAEFVTNIDTRKILTAPNAIDCKENGLLLGDLFNPNPINIIKTGINK